MPLKHRPSELLDLWSIQSEPLGGNLHIFFFELVILLLLLLYIVNICTYELFTSAWVLRFKMLKGCLGSFFNAKPFVYNSNFFQVSNHSRLALNFICTEYNNVIRKHETVRCSQCNHNNHANGKDKEHFCFHILPYATGFIHHLCYVICIYYFFLLSLFRCASFICMHVVSYYI